jgi:hypothetical protein
MRQHFKDSNSIDTLRLQVCEESNYPNTQQMKLWKDSMSNGQDWHLSLIEKKVLHQTQWKQAHWKKFF